MTQAFEYRHVIGFEETNLVGNVYYANHVKWQGRCREMFLRTHCPEILDDLSHGNLSLVTVRVACEYLAELVAFDEVVLRMRLENLKQNRITFTFEYGRIKNGTEEIVARGSQEIASMTKKEGVLSPTPIPEPIRKALRLYETPS